MEINVNLATRQFIDLRPLVKWLRNATASLAVLAVLVGSIAYMVHEKAERARNRTRNIEEKISGLRHERRAYQETLDHSKNVRLRREADGLNEIIDAKSFSWTQAMKDLEALLPEHLQVTAIEPTRAKDGSLTIHIRVLGPRERDVEFLSNLENSSRFLSPRIVGESRDKADAGPTLNKSGPSAEKIAEFNLFAEYDEDSPDIALPTAIRSSGTEPTRNVPSARPKPPQYSALNGTVAPSVVSAAKPKNPGATARMNHSALSGFRRAPLVSLTGSKPNPALPHDPALSVPLGPSVVSPVRGVK